jgi:hypothetical protein
MLPSRVAVSVVVEGIDPSRPNHSAVAAAAGAFGRLSPTRPLLVAVAGWGDAPAVAVTPWVLAGVRRAASDHGLGASAVDLASASMHGSQRRRITAAGLPLEPSDGRPVQLEIPGTRRPRRIPRPWIGQHLCLVVPCVHRRGGQPGDAGWVGPIAAGFAALDHACAPAGMHRDSAVAGARLAAQVFASTTLVVDASWWAPLHASDAGPPFVLGLDRCLVLSSEVPSEAWNLSVLDCFDGWLATRLQIDGASPRADSTMTVRGSAAALAWPRAPRRTEKPRGLAGQAIQALWSASRGRPRVAGPERALLPNVPGPLARWWYDYSTSAPHTGPR